MVRSELQSNGLQIILTPNRSATWQHNLHIIGLLSVVVFVISMFWAYMGVWIILPFAGAELAAVAYFIYRTSQNVHQQEVISMDANHVRIERGRHTPHFNIALAKEHCEFIITRPRHYLSAATIALEHCEDKLQLGAFLNRHDTDKLIDLIKSTGITYRVRGKTIINEIFPFDL
jgi:uncharacterized membrane protein